MDLLVIADRKGIVDKTPESIARITNVPLDMILRGLKVLEAPDPKSRTRIHDGRRLILLDQQRDWGWQIVNYEKYREMRDDEALRAANCNYKRAQRERERMAARSIRDGPSYQELKQRQRANVGAPIPQPRQAL